MDEIVRKPVVRLFKAARGASEAPAESAPEKEVLHFLHIGKTGGTAIKYALANTPSTECYTLKLHRHRTRLRNIPEGEKVMFFVRDPIARFVSGFYSRMRQGQPRYANPWKEGEEEAFALFKTPNELAMGLASEDEERRLAAVEAMKKIGHVRSSYWDWFENEEYLHSRFGDLYYIGFQENSREDFEAIKRKLRLPAALQLPTDDVEAHKTPGDLDRRLEPTALQALREWYARDYVFMKFCKEKADEINSPKAIRSILRNR